MNELVKIMRRQAICTSRDIAEHFRKRHDNVLRDIENLKKDMPEIEEMFFESVMPDSYGRKQRIFLMNRDGFTLLTMGFTGKKALEWKLKYIAAFNEMEKILTQQTSIEWKEARLLGKQARREETDEIKELITYAEGQGSTHADIMYVTYSKLVKKMLGIDSREMADTLTLSRAAEMERIIRHVIQDGIAAGENYKAIYQAAKARLAAFREIAFLTA